MNKYSFVVCRSPSDITHWKYIKKVKKNGKWRYYYDKDSLKRDIKKKAKSIVDSVKNIYNDPNNIYDVGSSNYNEKMKQIANSKEWQDIVRRQDPEYVRKNADGTVTYLIDDYLTKKKHPQYDILDDIASGRPITINKINKHSAIAGAKDYIRSKEKLLTIGIVALTETFKYQQGSYKDETDQAIKTAKTAINNGRVYVQTMNDSINAYEKHVNSINSSSDKAKKYVSEANKTVNKTVNKAVNKTRSSATSYVSEASKLQNKRYKDQR